MREEGVDGCFIPLFLVDKCIKIFPLTSSSHKTEMNSIYK